MLTIDGSLGEGGGQMLRTAVAFSLLTGTPFRMEKIRAGREKPGLKAQHLSILKAARKAWGAGVEGAEPGASEVAFQPGPLAGGTFEIDIGTAGSITLVMQTLLPALLFAPGRSIVMLRGGTDVSMSPTFEYFRRVVLPHAEPFAEEVSVRCDRRGFFPVGGGEVRLTVRPRFASWKDVRGALPPLQLLDRGDIAHVDVSSIASKDLEPHIVAQRQVQGVENELKGLTTRRDIEYLPSRSPGTSVTLVARLAGGGALGADALGARGTRAEEVGREAARKLKEELDLGAPVDRHLADHLVPWLALRGGSIRATEITDHTRTNASIVERFIEGRFAIDEAARTVNFPA